MGLESPTYVSDLTETWPLGGDGKSQGDNHLRIIKSALKNTFPNASSAYYFPRTVTKTANYTILATDDETTIRCDATGGAFTLSLPSAASAGQFTLNLIKVDASVNKITVDAAGSDLIDGSGYSTLQVPGQGEILICDGTRWTTLAVQRETKYATWMSSLPRNRIMNGDFRVDQRKVGAVQSTDGTSAVKLPDCWYSYGTAASGVFTTQREADALHPGRHRLKIACTTADAALAAADFYSFEQSIEGHLIRDFDIGLSSAAVVTVSFEVECTITGTFNFYMLNAAGNRWYIGQFTVDAANTREVKRFTFQMDTTGTWLTDSSYALIFGFSLAMGTDWHGVAGWSAGAGEYAVAGQTNFMSANTNVMYLADVQLEKGYEASRFERLDFAEQLRRCMRYVQKTPLDSVAPADGCGYVGALHAPSVVTTSGYFGAWWNFAEPMRAVPTLTFYNPGAAGTAAYWRNWGDTASSQPNVGTFPSEKRALILMNNGSPLAVVGSPDIYSIQALAEA